MTTVRHKWMIALAGAMLVSACTQSTPSMMNESRPEMVMETSLEQIPASEVSEGFLNYLAEDYRRYGSGPVKLSMTYDPASKTYTAMKAVNQLRSIETTLKRRGMYTISTETVAAPGQEATLLIGYDIVTARPPSDCGAMPGLTTNSTSRFLEDYRFGCGIESMLARQISRPADLQGRGTMGPEDGRRATNIVDQYRIYDAEEASEEMEPLGRQNIPAE